MTVPLPIDVDDLGRPDWIEHGVVAVHNHGFGHSQAVCSCGWTGGRRHLKAAAVQDAWLHCVHEKCTVSFPLVIPLARIA
jgi:hypothetical protein